MILCWSLLPSAYGVLLGCPVCARDNVPGAALLIGAMLAVPYAVAVVVIRAIRRADAVGTAGDQRGRP